MKRFPIAALFLLLAMVLLCSGCNRSQQVPSGKLQVVTTLFPLYDFARTIAGTKGDVTMLLPPGVEPHSFEPKPDDIVRINNAGLFIYTNRYMEPWAVTILKGVYQSTLKVVDAGQGVTYLRAGEGHGHEGNADHDAEHHAGGMDPHIWLDFGNAQLMVANILNGFLAADPANGEYYRKNAAVLSAALADLDQRYRSGLASCGSREILHGGHYAFGYLAHRYGLKYRAMTGVSSESEPSAAGMAAMVERIKRDRAHYIFAEELLSPRLTDTLANEAGVGVLKLNGAHNVSKDDFQRGVTFIDLMNENLKNLQKGLSCRTR